MLTSQAARLGPTPPTTVTAILYGFIWQNRNAGANRRKKAIRKVTASSLHSKIHTVHRRNALCRPSGRKFAELANHENCKYVEDQPVCNDNGNVYIKKSDYDASQGAGDIWTKSEKPMYRRLSDYCSHEDPEDPASELEGCVWAPYPLYTYQARCMQVKHATMTCD